MNTFPFLRSFLVALVALLAAFAPASQAQSGSREARPANRIVVLLDRSGSFKKNLALSRELAWKYVREIANNSPVDEVYIVGVDNHTATIAYVSGVRTRRDAQQEFEAAFAKTTDGRGTDWVEGFRIASRTFALAPKAGATHLLVFGDLKVDDETDDKTGAVLREFKELDSIDWAAFSNTKVSMWFVDDDAADELRAIPSYAALGAQLSTIESKKRASQITAPRQIKRAETGEAAAPDSSWIKWAVIAGALLVGLFVALRAPSSQ